MKIKEITLNNFANFDAITASFDPNFTLLIGRNGAGKSTLGINAIWFMFQGIAEKSSAGSSPLIAERFRFIGPNAATSKNQMVLIDDANNNAEIIVSRKLTKSGTELSFKAPDDYPGTLDQSWLNNLFNVFLIAPKMFTELSPKDQAKALGIDTTVYDDAVTALKLDFTMLSRDLKSFGELPPVEEVFKVNLDDLMLRKAAIRNKLNIEFQENKKNNEAIKRNWQDDKTGIDYVVTKFNEKQVAQKLKYDACSDAASILILHGFTDTSLPNWLSDIAAVIEPQKIASDLYAPEPTYIPEMPDDKDLQAVDQEILDAGVTNQKAMLYDQYKAKLEAKMAKEKEIADNKAKQKKKEQERIDYIKKFEFPFSNISVGEDGELLLQGKPIKEPYFSTGEILKIVPILISTRKPELKYVFLQDFNLMDDEKQKEIEDYLIGQGFQLVVELVGKAKITDKNCILLRDNVIVESYEEKTTPALL